MLTDTNTHEIDLEATLPTKNHKKEPFIEIADGKIAHNGDQVVDIRSGMEGTLTFGLWYWTVLWEDQEETVVADASILKLK